MKILLTNLSAVAASILIPTACSSLPEQGTDSAGSNATKTVDEQATRAKTKPTSVTPATSAAAGPNDSAVVSSGPAAAAKPEKEKLASAPGGGAPKPDEAARAVDPGDLILEQVRRAQREQQEAIAKASKGENSTPEGEESRATDNSAAPE